MAAETKKPEVYYTIPNAHCPNSHLPVLVYRNVLPPDLSIESASAMFAANDWAYDQSWGHDDRAHYHTTTPECYAATRGHTKCLYGVGPLDDESQGLVFEMRAGDVAVHAAGVSHRHLVSSGDYRFMACYPKDFPPWDSHLSTADVVTTESRAKRAREVPIPKSDPIYGLNGPLPTLWKEADAAA